MAFAFRDVDLSCLGLLCAAIGLATGNFKNSRGLFANLSDHQLLAVYSGAFSVLTYTLMGITLLAVMVCFMTLRKVQIAFNSGMSK
ncbi:hypothetical protein KKJ17_08520 [Xenorhabdus bovienii]|uniref:hypothetical protein n=1 Tax=Xenorhabdus bovienii TaxID=40576 RepID=UPI00237D2B25|nr:hypothetical protein [Xenorhabdus bovienii]MDE1473186.1 hypothetical protein [Xenorhabdus bovienii]MDE9456896.1 hypothetical protein [Xenorhabdus bovienii]MDE9485410.1 hypothetical protein [Xenorhabdus bovienii]MDE9492129.1 hypothetical protein [Xenorhabdus bovienii]MDE9500522.1 hypothetical protein [Xenorhabdus bovienii]